MNEVDRFYAESRRKPSPAEEPIPDDILAVWLTGITAVASIVGVVVWIVSLL